MALLKIRKKQAYIILWTYREAAVLGIAGLPPPRERDDSVGGVLLAADQVDVLRGVCLRGRVGAQHAVRILKNRRTERFPWASSPYNILARDLSRPERLFFRGEALR